MRVLSISADRSKRGILYPESPAAARQRAYGERFDALDIIGFSRTSDDRKEFDISQKVHVYPTNSISPLFYGLNTFSILRKLPKPDVITVQDPFETGLLGVLISWMKGVPLHVQVHTDFLSPEYVQHSFLNRIRMSVAGIVLRHATRVRVVSERIHNELGKLCRAPISVLPIYVDVGRFKNNTVQPEIAQRFALFQTKILIVARLEKEKNIQLAIEVFAKRAPESACLIIVGEGSMRTELENSARFHVVSARVFFEGTQDADSYYPLADLVLVTSTYEGYGLVTIEALAAGKPVLSTDVGIAREAGAIVTSAESFADSLAEWFKNGPRTGELKGYPYKNFDEYVQAYCDDIIACIREK